MIWKSIGGYEHQVIVGGPNNLSYEYNGANGFQRDHRISSILVDTSLGQYGVLNFTPGGFGGHRYQIYVEDLLFVGDSVLNLYVDIGDRNSSYGVDFLVRDKGEGTLEALKHISFQGMRVNAYLDYYNRGYYLITKGYEPWTPVPEASTYGAVLSFSALAVGFIRKRKRRRANSLTPSEVPV